MSQIQSEHAVEGVTSSERRVAGLGVTGLSKGSGPPLVVFHHSFGSPGWIAFYEALAETATVHVPDLPGFGSSDRPAWARHPRDLAIVMGHWLRTLGDGPVALVGMGYGGWVAAELATMAPELLGSLVLVGSAGMLPDDGKIEDQVLVASGVYVRSAFADPAAFEAIYGTEFSDDTLVQWEINREMVVRTAWKPYMYNRQMVPLLAEVRVPTLIVWGTQDRVVPAVCATQFQAALADARLEFVEGAGHAVDMEAPLELARLVRAHIA
jgi:pimeloyl-ACP methyl ester carboxylesterase